MDKKLITPIIAGDTAIFEWNGPKAPQLIGDFNRWDGNHAFTLAPAGKNLWRHSLKLPLDAYIEYTFLLDGKRVSDPTNPHRCYNGISAYNQYFYMPEAAPTRLARKVRGVPHGIIKRLKVPGRYFLGAEDHGIRLFERDVFLYQPPVSGPVPLLVVFDGPDYLSRAKLPLIIDNLIHQKRIKPLALAMIANGKKNRFIEYACSDVTLGFVLFNLIPLAKRELNLIDIEKQHGAFGTLGASMGGLISLYAGLRHPEVFGHVLSQSGAFYPKFVVNDLVHARQSTGIKIWMDVGTMEYLITFNRNIHALLMKQGYSVAYQEYTGGHNYTAWRDEIPAGLESLFGV